MSSSVKKSVAKLLTGDVGAALIGLATFALIAGYLGPKVFGVLILLETYVLIFTNFLKPQTWQLLVTYSKSKTYDGKFSQLVTLGVIFDIVFVILSFFSALLLMGYYFDVMSIPTEYFVIGLIVLSQLLFNFDGVAIGLLRITEEHGLSAIRSIVIAIIKLILIAAVVFLDLGLIGLAYSIVIAKVLGIVYLNFFAWRTLITKYSFEIKLFSLKETKILSKFIFFTGATAGLKTSFREVDILIVGKLLSLPDVAALQIVKKIINVPLRLSNPLGNVIYVKFSKIFSDGYTSKYNALKRKSYLAIIGYVSLCVLSIYLIPEGILISIFGPEFEGLMPVLEMYSLSMFFTLMCIPPSYSLLAKGYSKQNFQIHLITSILYFPLMGFFVSAYGLFGVALAVVSFGFMRFIALFIMDEKND
ncbi:oligosaccharide flippase family protein [Vibrio vulnificus]|nr:oligosaccharide flippase family protein [Vibrio vulnificus]